jgi:prevent-host-death family protein
MALRALAPHPQFVLFRMNPYGIDYRDVMKTTTKTAEQVRIPKVAADEAVIVTRHGQEIAAVVSIQDYRLLANLKAAIAATRPAPYRPSEAALEAWATDADEYPTEDEWKTIGRGAER